jgi:hypothetical protein
MKWMYNLLLLTLIFTASFSQTTKPIAVLQALDMTRSSTSDVNYWDGYTLIDKAGAYVSQSVLFPTTATYRIDVSGYSSAYQQGIWGNMRIKIDGVLKGSVIVSSESPKIYSFLITNISAGQHTVLIDETSRVGPSVAGRTWIGLVYITQTTSPAPYVYPAIVKQPLSAGQTINSLHFGSGVLRGFNLGTANVTEADLIAMKSTGANIARYFIKVDRITGTNTYKFVTGESAKSDSLVARATRLGFYVVPTLEIFPEGTAEDFWGTDANGIQRRASIINLWKDLANRYKGKARIAAYNPINEPRNNRRYANWINYLSQIIEAIRVIDPTHCIIVEHSYTLEMFGMMQPLPYTNLVYSIHGYPPLRITHQGVFPGYSERVAYPVTTATPTQPVFTKTELSAALKEIRSFAHTFNIPVFIGEFSCVNWALNGTATKWIDDNISLLEAENWAWTTHAFREAECWDPEIPYSTYNNVKFDANGTPVISSSTQRAARTMSAPTMVMLKGYFALNKLGVFSFQSFSGTLSSGKINLAWTTTNPPGVSYFNIYKKNSSTASYSYIGQVSKKTGTTQTLSYNFTDNSPQLGSNYYRIKEVSVAGTYTYSKEIIVQVATLVSATYNNVPGITGNADENSKPFNFRLFPDPAMEKIKIDFDGPKNNQRANLSIQNLSGSILKKISLILSGKPIEINVSSLSSGMYILRLAGDNFVIDKQFLKIK